MPSHEPLVDRLADGLAEVEAETLGDRLGDCEAEPLVDRQNKLRRRTQKNQNVFLTLRIIVTDMGHMIFIMLKKKSLTIHLLLTNPTAVFLNND